MIDAFRDVLLEWLALPNTQIGLGIAVAVLVLLLVLFYLVARPIDAVPAFANANGDVAIARRAVHQIIEHRCLAFKAVGHAHAEVQTKSGKLRALVEIRVRPDVRLEDLAEQLQNEVTVLLKDNLGLKNVGDVDVLVVGLHRD